MILSHSKKFIFFACGKTGTTSIEAVLKPYHDGDETLASLYEAVVATNNNPKHVRPEMAKKHLPAEVWNDYFKFVFVRNPWDWVVSQYFFSNFKKTKWDLFARKIRARHVEIVWSRLNKFNPIVSDESYLQSSFVFGCEGDRLIDFVGHYERLQEDFDVICQRLGLPQVALPVKNVSGHKPYQKLYTRGSKALVGNLYERDIQLLGYEFDGMVSEVRYVQGGVNDSGGEYEKSVHC